MSKEVLTARHTVSPLQTSVQYIRCSKSITTFRTEDSQRQLCPFDRLNSWRSSIASITPWKDIYLFSSISIQTEAKNTYCRDCRLYSGLHVWCPKILQLPRAITRYKFRVVSALLLISIAMSAPTPKVRSAIFHSPQTTGLPSSVAQVLVWNRSTSKTIFPNLHIYVSTVSGSIALEGINAGLLNILI